MTNALTIYTDGILRAIIRPDELPTVMEIYPLIYPGQRIDVRPAEGMFDERGRLK